MDGSYRSRQGGFDDDEFDGRSTRQRYRPPTLSALTAEADALQRPSGALTLGLKNVKGAIASANAIPEDSVRNWTSQNDIERALDHSHSRLTFRANLTTLTEAERRKLESHRAGEDLYDKMAIKDNMPEWLSGLMATPLKASQEYMAQPQNALTPVQPYTPPHLDPISPAIVSRDYWKANPRRDSAREDRHHRRHSPRKEGHDKKRDRSPEGHHHRHHRSDKKRRHSSRHDDYDRHRHRERDRNGDGRRRRRDHASDGKGIGRRPRPEPYVDPGLVPDPLAVSGKAIRISPSKRSSDRSSASVDVANWVRSTSQPVETSLRPSGPLQQANQQLHSMAAAPRTMQATTFQPHQPVRQNQIHRSANQIEEYDGQRFYPVVSNNEHIHPRPPLQNLADARPFTPRNLQPVNPILQPVPQRPIPISRLTQASRPATLIPVPVVAPPRAFQGANGQGSRIAAPSNTSGPSFQFDPAMIHHRASQTPAPGLGFAGQPLRAFQPIGQAIRDARVNTQQPMTRIQAASGNASSPNYDTATDSGYGQALVRKSYSQTGQSGYAEGAQSLAPTNTPGNPSEGFVFYCGTGTQEPPKSTRNEQPSESVWNPNLANCTATKPRRLTLKQDNHFEEADRKYRAEAMRDSITIVKNSIEARHKPASNGPLRTGPTFASQRNRG